MFEWIGLAIWFVALAVAFWALASISGVEKATLEWKERFEKRVGFLEKDVGFVAHEFWEDGKPKDIRGRLEALEAKIRERGDRRPPRGKGPGPGYTTRQADLDVIESRKG